ncbi:hypothetical protein ABGB07_32360 [Micromonosporaceae bacterium B7E4]
MYSAHEPVRAGDNPCALNVSTAYLVDGVRPKDTFCGSATLALGVGSAQRRADTLGRLHVSP